MSTIILAEDIRPGDREVDEDGTAYWEAVSPIVVADGHVEVPVRFFPSRSLDVYRLPLGAPVRVART